MKMNNVSIFRSIDELSQAAAEIIYQDSIQSIEINGRFVIALSGGKTPASLFKLLANPPYAEKLDWKNIFIFWSDERFVPMDNENNNSHQAKKLLLDHVPIPAENIFTPQVQMPPSAAATQYVNMLNAFFKVEVPAFDIVLVGMGDDGHTASLFPGTHIDQDYPGLVEAVAKDNDPIKRLTFTPQLINNSKRVLVLVSGESKAKVLAEVFSGKAKNRYPIQMLLQKKLEWLLDADAASLIKK